MVGTATEVMDIDGLDDGMALLFGKANLRSLLSVLRQFFAPHP